jgi:hypothetical protein
MSTWNFSMWEKSEEYVDLWRIGFILIIAVLAGAVVSGASLHSRRQDILSRTADIVCIHILLRVDHEGQNHSTTPSLRRRWDNSS